MAVRRDMARRGARGNWRAERGPGRRQLRDDSEYSEVLHTTMESCDTSHKRSCIAGKYRLHGFGQQLLYCGLLFKCLSFYWVVICCSLVPLKFIPIMTTPHFVNKWFYVTKVLMYFVFNIWLVSLDKVAKSLESICHESGVKL